MNLCKSVKHEVLLASSHLSTPSFVVETEADITAQGRTGPCTKAKVAAYRERGCAEVAHPLYLAKPAPLTLSKPGLQFTPIYVNHK